MKLGIELALISILITLLIAYDNHRTLKRMEDKL